MKAIGIVILVVGLMITVFTRLNFVTEKKVVDVGKLEITRDKKHGLEWSPLIGVAVMVIGGGVYFYGTKRN